MDSLSLEHVGICVFFLFFIFCFFILFPGSPCTRMGEIGGAGPEKRFARKSLITRQTNQGEQILGIHVARYMYLKSPPSIPCRGLFYFILFYFSSGWGRTRNRTNEMHRLSRERARDLLSACFFFFFLLFIFFVEQTPVEISSPQFVCIYYST